MSGERTTSPIDTLYNILDGLIDGVGRHTAPLRVATSRYTKSLTSQLTLHLFSEPFFILLCVFYLCVVVYAWRKRRQLEPLAWLFIASLLLATLSQPLNEFGHEHAGTFASRNYFVQSGSFIIAIWGLPMVLIAVFCLFLLCCVAPWGLSDGRPRTPRVKRVCRKG